MPANKLLLAVTVVAAAPPPAAAHDPITTKLTWTRDISRLVYKHCAGCHRPGGTTPMALLDYSEARPWAKAIKEEILERRMPPGAAIAGFGNFVDHFSLSQEEMHLIADWVEGGAPEGDPVYLPPKPTLPPPARASAPFPLGETLDRPTAIHSIRAAGLPKGASLRVIAATPSGESIPLLWIYNYQPKWTRTYTYRQPVRLPAGTRILRTAPARVFIGRSR